MTSFLGKSAAGSLILAAGLLAGGCALVGVGHAPVSSTVVSKDTIEAAVRDVKPALVRIRVVSPTYREGRQMKFVSFGSGTIISPDGYVVTNHHVAGSALQLTVTLANREEVGATLIGTDPATDIAVIKLDPLPDGSPYPFASFGDSDKMAVGDPVLALGSPLALSQSVTLGILSNAEMVTPPSFGQNYRFELDGEDVGRLVRWFGHDAVIFPGNSGGPLINLAGEIIGVNEIGMGLGGAIPGNLARDVAEALVKHGQVERAFFGLESQALLKASGLRRGMLVSSINPDSPAEESGLQTGDIILSIDGREFEGRFAEDFPAINNFLATRPIGKALPMRVLRGGQELDMTITAVPRESAFVPGSELREWGMTARNVNRWTNMRLARERQGGVLVTSSRSGGPISRGRPELRVGDLITKIEREPIADVEALQSATARLALPVEGTFTPVLVEFEREGEIMWSVVEIGIEALQPAGREVQRAWLPVETQVVTREIARQLGDENLKGVRVTRVYEERPENFPVEVGDIITHVDGDAVEAMRQEDAEVFRTLIRQYRRGAQVDFRVLRDGETKTFPVTLMSSPPQTREMNRFRDLDFEFTVREASFNDRHRPAMVGEEFAVIVDAVTNGGWASVAGLGVGDAILEINGEKINSIDDVAREMDNARAEKARWVVFLVRSGTSRYFLEIETAW